MVKRRRKTLPKERLSPSEWQIMQICWRLGSCTVREVLREDSKAHNRDYRTILTFMTRMATKGWLIVRKRGNTNRYSPSVAEGTALEAEIRRFLETVVGQKPASRRLVREILAGASRDAESGE